MSAVVNRPDISVRSATAEDVSAIMEIETAVYPFPWTRSIFADCIRVGYSCLLCESGDQLIAYAVMSSGANEAHLLNLCVHPDWQSRGIGRELLNKMLVIAKERAVDTVFLEVRPSNQAALSLYDSLGFNNIGTRRDYYPAKGGREDAVILALSM